MSQSLRSRLWCAYHATKAAVRHVIKHAAVTYAADKVRVNAIHPGITATPVLENQAEESTAKVIAATPMGRMAKPIENRNRGFVPRERRVALHDRRGVRHRWGLSGTVAPDARGRGVRG